METRPELTCNFISPSHTHTHEYEVNSEKPLVPEIKITSDNVSNKYAYVRFHLCVGNTLFEADSYDLSLLRHVQFLINTAHTDDSKSSKDNRREE